MINLHRHLIKSVIALAAIISVFVLSSCQLIKEARDREFRSECLTVFKRMENSVKLELRKSLIQSMRCSSNSKECDQAALKLKQMTGLLQDYGNSDAGAICGRDKNSIYQNRSHYIGEFNKLLLDLRAKKTKTPEFRLRSENLYRQLMLKVITKKQ